MKNIARTKEELMIEIHKLQRQVEDFQKSKDIRDKKLIKAIHNWQSTFDSISDSVTLIDSKGIIQLCNKATLELLEKPVEKIVGSICWEAVHGTSEPIAKCPFAKMRETHKRESKIMVVDDRLYEITVDPQFDERDNLIGGVHIISDITKRTKINEILKEDEEKYHSLFLKMLNGFALHEIVVDRANEPEDYTFLEINDEFEKQTGLKRENILGKKVTQIIPGIEDDPANFIETYGEVAQTGKEIKFEYYSQTLKKWFSILAFSPKKNQFATISEDITEQKKAEEELNISSKKWQSAFDALSNPVCFIDLEGIVRTCNDTTSKFLGIPISEIINSKFFELFHGSSKPIENCPFTKMKKSGNRESSVFKIKDKWLNIKVHPVRDSENKVIGGVYIVEDITKQKKAQDSISESENRFRMLFEKAPLSYQSLDENGKFSDVNETWLKTFGYKREEIIGKWFGNFLTPEHVDFFKKDFQKFKSEGEVSKKEYEILKKDGKKAFVSLHNRIRKDKAGNLKQIHSILFDISEQKKAKEELNISSKKWQSAFDALSNPVCFIDLEGIVRTCNEITSKFLGIPVSDIINSKFFELFHGSSKPIENCPFTKMKKSGNRESSVFKIKDKWLNIKIHPVRDSENKVIGGVYIVEDITEQKKTQDSISESENKFRMLFEKAPLSYQSLDENGKFSDINETWLKTFGYKREEIIGKWFGDFLTPEHVGFFKKDFQKFKSEGEVSKKEYEILRKDGKKALVTLNSRIRKDKAGNLKQIHSILFDISEQKKAKEELSISSKKWRTTFDALSNSVCLINPEGIIEICNRTTSKFLEIPVSKIINSNCCKLFHGPLKSIEDCPFTRMKKSGNKESSEFQIKDKWLRIEVHPINDKENNLIGGIHIAEDITEQKKIQNSLNENEKRFQILFNKAPLCFQLLDKNGKLLDVNETWLESFGYIRDKIIGNMFIDFLTPGSSTHFKKILQKIITDGIISGTELEMIKKDGKKIFISFAGKIIKGEDAEFEHIHCIIQDITEQKDAEQALYESEKQLQNIYENINIGYFRSKPDGKILVANPALLKMLGYDSFQELSDQNLEEKNMLIDSSQNEFNKMMKEKDEVKNFEAKLRKNGGSRIYVYESIKAIKDKKGEIHYYEGTVEDITKRKKTEHEIHSQQEHIDLINKFIMHELTKHLTVINNTIKNYRKSKEEEYLDESIKRIKKNLKLLNKMRELELFVSSEREQVPINVERIFQEIKNNYKAIEFNITGSATILADKFLYSVFDNIIRNAVVHGSASKIDIEINNKRNFCEIRISDDGVGITDEKKKQICEEGFKFSKKGHTGLGLFIVKKAMESYEGSIQVEDNKPDGAVFILTFKNMN